MRLQGALGRPRDTETERAGEHSSGHNRDLMGPAVRKEKGRLRE